MEEAHERGRLLTLEGRSQNIRCPLLVVFGAGDRLISPAEGERLARWWFASSQTIRSVYRSLFQNRETLPQLAIYSRIFGHRRA
jgi:hypothetical protein